MKALLVETDNTITEIELNYPGDYLVQIEKHIDAECLDIVTTHRDTEIQGLVFCDDLGYTKDLPINRIASIYYSSEDDSIRGDVVITSMKFGEDGYESCDITTKLEDYLNKLKSNIQS